MVGKSLNFLVFGLEHHFYQEHFTLLLNKFVTVFFVLIALSRDSEPVDLHHADLGLHLRVDGQSTGLNISLAQFAEAALSRGPVLLPDPLVPVVVLLVDLAAFFIILECENHFIAGDAERIVPAVTTARGGLTTGGVEGVFVLGFLATVLSVVVTGLRLTIRHFDF
jgi:hypothetical protein